MKTQVETTTRVEVSFPNDLGADVVEIVGYDDDEAACWDAIRDAVQNHCEWWNTEEQFHNLVSKCVAFLERHSS